MKIVADENIPLVDAFFAGVGSVVKRPGRQLSAADVSDADALLVRSVTPVNAALLANAPSLSFVGTCTIGIDHLDTDYFQQNNIAWSSAPGCNALSVVEYVYAALCHLDMNWQGKKFGIIGCGNVGGLLYRRLKAQGMDCYCYDPLLTTEQNADLCDLETVLSCDIISMHTPLTKTGAHPSFHLIGAGQLAQLKPGAVLLNCGRGPVIDNQALLAFLQQRDDVRVVLDVWEPEPVISRALQEKVEIGTPHIAGYSYDGKLNGTEMIYQALCRHLKKDAEVTIKQLVPPLVDNRRVFADGDSWAALKQLIASIYDITADDAAMRALAETAGADDEAFGRGFDNLRKQYPVRREFHNYLVECPADPQISSWLNSLGFNTINRESK